MTENNNIIKKHSVLFNSIYSVCNNIKTANPFFLEDVKKKITENKFNNNTVITIDDININPKDEIFDQLNELKPIIKMKNSLHIANKIEDVNMEKIWLVLFDQIKLDLRRTCKLLIDSSNQIDNDKLNILIKNIWLFDKSIFKLTPNPSIKKAIIDINTKLDDVKYSITYDLIKHINNKNPGANIKEDDIYDLSDEYKKKIDQQYVDIINDIQARYHQYKTEYNKIYYNQPEILTIENDINDFRIILNIINSFFDLYNISPLIDDDKTLRILKDILSKTYIIGTLNNNVIQKRPDDTPDYQIYNKIYYSLDLLFLLNQGCFAQIKTKKYDSEMLSDFINFVNPNNGNSYNMPNISFDINGSTVTFFDINNRLLVTSNNSFLTDKELKNKHQVYVYYQYYNILNDSEIEKMGFHLHNNNMFEFNVYDSILKKYINYWSYFKNRKEFATFLFKYSNDLSNYDINNIKKLHIIRCLDNNDNFNGLRMVNDSRNMKQINTSGYKTYKRLTKTDLNIRNYVINQKEKLLLYYDNKKSILGEQKCINIEKELFNEIYNFIINKFTNNILNNNNNYVIVINHLLLKYYFKIDVRESDIVSIHNNILKIFKYKSTSINEDFMQTISINHPLFNINNHYKLFFICKPEDLLDYANDTPLSKQGLDSLNYISDKLFNIIYGESINLENIVYISGSSESSITTATFLATTKSKLTESKPELCYYFNKLHIIYYLRTILGLYKKKLINMHQLLSYFEKIERRLSYSIEQDENDKNFIDYLIENRYNLSELYKFPACLSRFLVDLLKNQSYTKLLDTYYDPRFNANERVDLFNFINIIRCAKQPKYIRGVYSKVLDKTELSTRLITPSITSNSNQSVQIFNYSVYDATGDNGKKINSDTIATYNGLLKYYFDDNNAKISTCDKENYNLNYIFLNIINNRYKKFRAMHLNGSLKFNLMFVLDLETISKYLNVNKNLVKKYNVIKIFKKNVYFFENDTFIEINQITNSDVNNIFQNSLNKIFEFLRNREYITIYLINASHIINQYNGLEIDIPLSPTEFTLFKELGYTLFNLEKYLRIFDTYYFTSYHSNYILATTTIAMQNREIDKIPKNIGSLHLIKTLEYISRNISLRRLNNEDVDNLFNMNNNSYEKNTNYSNYFGLSQLLQNHDKFKNIMTILDQLIFNIDSTINLKFIMRYDYLYLLRKYMNIQGFFNNNDINNNKNANRDSNRNNIYNNRHHSVLNDTKKRNSFLKKFMNKTKTIFKKRSNNRTQKNIVNDPVVKKPGFLSRFKNLLKRT